MIKELRRRRYGPTSKNDVRHPSARGGPGRLSSHSSNGNSGWPLEVFKLALEMAFTTTVTVPLKTDFSLLGSSEMILLMDGASFHELRIMSGKPFATSIWRHLSSATLSRLARYCS